MKKQGGKVWNRTNTNLCNNTVACYFYIPFIYLPEKVIRMGKQYLHLFFDLDHTLWDFKTNARESLKEMYATFHLKGRGIPTFESFHHQYFVHNAVLWERFRKGFITQKELKRKRMWLTLLDFKIADADLAASMDQKYLELLPQKKVLMPFSRKILDYLKQRGYPMHLITNGFRDAQLQKLNSSQITDYFQNIITSETVGKSKPAPEIFEYALAKTACPPEKALMVGDTLEADILGAGNAGIDSVYYNAETPPTAGIKPTYYIKSLSGLEKIL